MKILKPLSAIRISGLNTFGAKYKISLSTDMKTNTGIMKKKWTNFKITLYGNDIFNLLITLAFYKEWHQP